MARVRVTDARRDWLKANYGERTLSSMAREMGCCVDTLKRILVREQIAEFDGAKFALRRGASVKTWRRPCMRCKCTKPRDKNHYLCDRCKKSEVF